MPQTSVLVQEIGTRFVAWNEAAESKFVWFYQIVHTESMRLNQT